MCIFHNGFCSQMIFPLFCGSDIDKCTRVAYNNAMIHSPQSGMKDRGRATMKKRFVLLAALLLAASMMLVSCDGMTSGGLIEKIIERLWGDPDNVPGDISQMLESIPPDLTLPEDITLPDDPTWGSTDEPNPPAPEPIYSEGLAFSSNGDGTCSLIGIGTCTDIYVVIPEYSPMGEKVTVIATGAFSGNSESVGRVKGITIPSTVTFIFEDAIYSDGALEQLVVSDGNSVYYSENNCIITKTGKSVIAGCKTSVIPDGVVSIGELAFFDCGGWMRITMPNSVLEIEEQAFSGCYHAMTLKISDGVKTIGNYAFSGCTSLTSVYIPDNVEHIGIGVFDYCFRLTGIEVSENNVNYVSIDNCLIEKNSNTLIAGCKNSIIPGSVTSIEERAFSHVFESADGATHIVIPNSVISIGEMAFNGCRALTDVYFMGTEEEWHEIEIMTGNSDLLNATIHFNYVPEE